MKGLRIPDSAGGCRVVGGTEEFRKNIFKMPVPGRSEMEERNGYICITRLHKISRESTYAAF